MITRQFVLCLLALGMCSVAPAWSVFDSGSDGSDRAFNRVANPATEQELTIRGGRG